MLESWGHWSDFAAFLRRTVGHVGYIIGTRGEEWTQAKQTRWLANETWRSRWPLIRDCGPMWLGKPVADCMGWYEMWHEGGDVGKPVASYRFPDMNTYAFYDLARKEGLPNGEIGTLPKEKAYPIAVGFPGHVGFYLDGVVYQSAGHCIGTVKTNLDDTRLQSSPWKYWYHLPYLDYTIEAEDEMLKRGDKGDNVRFWQRALIAWNANALPKFKDDGDFGGETEAWTKEFQKAFGIVQSGVVDLNTFTRMTERLRTLPTFKAEYDAAKAKIASLESGIATLNSENIILKNKVSSVSAWLNNRPTI